VRAVKPISHSRWNVGFGAHSGPSEGGPCRPDIRPYATMVVRSASDRTRPFAVLPDQPRDGRRTPESRRRCYGQKAGGLNVNPPNPMSNEYLEAIRQESSAEWDCRHRAMAAQAYPEIMPDDLFPIPSPRVDQPDNQGPEGNTP
jgi:hypothetical protein